MDHVDITKLFDKYPAEFSAASSMTEFVSSIPVKDAYREFLRKYADDGSWGNLSFLTFKAHGFTGKPLHMPQVSSFDQLFSSVYLADYELQRSPYGPASGTMFVSTLSAREVAWFGHTSGNLYIRTRADGSFFCFGIERSKTRMTIAKARPELVSALSNRLMSDRWFSIELIQWQDGRILVVGRDGHSIGSCWLTILPAGASLTAMLSPAEQKEIAEWQAYEASVKSCVTGETVDFDRARELGVEIRRDKY